MRKLCIIAKSRPKFDCQRFESRPSTYLDRGVHPILKQWCIVLPVSDLPPISETFFELREKCSQLYLFPKKFSIFIRQIFWRPFFLLVIDHKFRMSPLFSLFQYIFSIFINFSFPPTFTNFPPLFRKIYVLYILSVFFVSPYFDHDAFMHHTMHVLDAPVFRRRFQIERLERMSPSHLPESNQAYQQVRRRGDGGRDNKGRPVHARSLNIFSKIWNRGKCIIALGGGGGLPWRQL